MQMVAMETNVIRFKVGPSLTFVPSLVAIGPQTAEEIVNGQTDGQIQIIVWFKCSKTQKIILIRCYAKILRTTSPRGHWVQKIKVVGNSFLNSYTKEFFEY